MEWSIDRLIDWSTINPLIVWLIDYYWLIDWSNEWLIEQQLNHWLIDWLIETGVSGISHVSDPTKLKQTANCISFYMDFNKTKFCQVFYLEKFLILKKRLFVEDFVVDYFFNKFIKGCVFVVAAPSMAVPWGHGHGDVHGGAGPHSHRQAQSHRQHPPRQRALGWFFPRSGAP